MHMIWFAFNCNLLTLFLGRKFTTLVLPIYGAILFGDIEAEIQFRKKFPVQAYN